MTDSPFAIPDLLAKILGYLRRLRPVLAAVCRAWRSSAPVVATGGRSHSYRGLAWHGYGAVILWALGDVSALDEYRLASRADQILAGAAAGGHMGLVLQAKE